jgi:hypothetical protein
VIVVTHVVSENETSIKSFEDFKEALSNVND